MRLWFARVARPLARPTLRSYIIGRNGEFGADYSGALPRDRRLSPSKTSPLQYMEFAATAYLVGNIRRGRVFLSSFMSDSRVLWPQQRLSCMRWLGRVL